MHLEQNFLFTSSLFGVFVFPGMTEDGIGLKTKLQLETLWKFVLQNKVYVKNFYLRQNPFPQLLLSHTLKFFSHFSAQFHFRKINLSPGFHEGK